MKHTLNFYEFCEGFKKLNINDAFSYEGKKALFEYLQEYEADTGQEIEFDVIALCCEFTEYEDIHEYIKDFGTGVDDLDFEDDEEEFLEAVKEEIQENATFIDVAGGSFIIQTY